MVSLEWKISIHPLPIASTLPPPPQAKPSSTTKENSNVYELAEIYPCFGRTSYCSQWIILHNMNRSTALHHTDPCLQIWRVTIKFFLFYEGTFTHIYMCIYVYVLKAKQDETRLWSWQKLLLGKFRAILQCNKRKLLL